MRIRYKLHWRPAEHRPFRQLKWEIWDWNLRIPIAQIENRAIGRQVCKVLNDSVRMMAAVKRSQRGA
jgi:hypothetical protein